MTTPPRFPGRISDWILHKDKQLLVFNKPAGLPVQGTKTDDPNLLGMGAAYARHDLYLVHRLDQPVSGAVILAKKPSAQAALSVQFRKGKVEKEYLAIVGERPAKDEDTLKHYLKNASGNRSAVDDNPSPNAKLSELSYRYLGSSDRYHLLAVKLKTGRKHQIRAQLAAIGSPLRGDTKYGFKRANPDNRIDLHAHRITFTHPTSEQRTTVEAPLPEGAVWEAFASLVG